MREATVYTSDRCWVDMVCIDQALAGRPERAAALTRDERRVAIHVGHARGISTHQLARLLAKPERDVAAELRRPEPLDRRGHRIGVA